MDFPERTPQHITETASWHILKSTAPDHWLVREVSERDYGIDAYVELVTLKGEVTGDLCSIQLKGSEKIEWQKDKKQQRCRATYSIDMPTINYWMGLPVPVFLVWADVTEKQAFLAPVKSQVRKQYDKYLTQQSLSFEFLNATKLGTDLGLAAFIAFYFREKFFARFHSTLREVLIHCDEYLEFIQEYQCRDHHLGMESDEEMMVQHIYRTCHFLAQFLGIDWKIISLAEMYKQDEEVFESQYYSLHQHSANQLFAAIEPVYVEIIEKCRERVMGTEVQFWRKSDYLLHHHCETMNVENLKRK